MSLSVILLKYSFTTACIICTFIMIGYWLYKFRVEDRDIGVVDYVSIEDAVDIKLPLASLCFSDPFLRDKLKEYPGMNGTDINSAQKRAKVLMGEDFIENFYRSDYRNLTFDLDDFLAYGLSQTRNETNLKKEPFHCKEHFNGISEDGFLVFEKCFEITMNKPSSRVSHIFVGLDLNRLSKNIGTGYFGYSVVIHYPGQYLIRVSLPNRFQQSNVKDSVDIDIENIEIIKSRNSRNRKCTPYDKNKSFDDMVLDAHITNKGCNVPYLKQLSGFPNCNTEERLKDAVYDFRTAREKYLPVSCQRLSRIAYAVKTQKTTSWYKRYWLLKITYPKYLRIITQSQEVDIHSLIGNIGGYVGLFLGNLFSFHIIPIT